MRTSFHRFRLLRDETFQTIQTGDIVMAGSVNTGILVIHALREIHNSDYDSVGNHPRHRRLFIVKEFITFHRERKSLWSLNEATGQNVHSAMKVIW